MTGTRRFPGPNMGPPVCARVTTSALLKIMFNNYGHCVVLFGVCIKKSTYFLEIIIFHKTNFNCGSNSCV